MFLLYFLPYITFLWSGAWLAGGLSWRAFDYNDSFFFHDSLFWGSFCLLFFLFSCSYEFFILISDTYPLHFRIEDIFLLIKRMGIFLPASYWVNLFLMFFLFKFTLSSYVSTLFSFLQYSSFLHAFSHSENVGTR